MPILDMQRRARELGRIRLGQKGDRGQPQKLDRFRITSPSQTMIEKVAALYGGEVKPWTNGGVQHFEVLTESTRLPILVPPQPVSQWLETWTGGGCVHRCDGVTNVLTAEPCDQESADHLNAKPTTRLNVVLADVEGIGVWRLESHGWNAAAELPFLAEFLSTVGGYVRAWLGLEERVVKRISKNGKAETLRFMVPTIEIEGLTPAQILAGQGAVTQVEAAPERLAIEASPEETAALARHADWIGEAARLTGVEDLRALWRQASAAGAPPDVLADIAEYAKAAGQASQEAPAIESRVAPGIDTDTVWREIIDAAGALDPPMTTDALHALFEDMNGGLTADKAEVAELVEFRDHLKGMVK